ncbi:MAG: DUF4270 family protein [Chitinophagaceae bacterium]
MKHFLTAFFFIVTILILEQSCQKIDTTDLGVDLIPAVDNVNTFDTTLEVITGNSFLTDSSIIIRTEDHALGVMEDPEFGKTSADIYFNILPSTSLNPFPNKDSIKGMIDSVVLSLAFAGLYGDSNSIENISVYEIDPTARLVDSSYPISTPDFPVLLTPLGEKTVNFETLNDPQTVKQGKDILTETSVLRIRLNKSLGERLARYDSTKEYKTDSGFTSFFKGLAIRTDSVRSARKKALAYFKLSDNTKTRLTVYYRTTINGVTDTTFANFIYKTAVSAKSANVIRRNFAGTSYGGNIANTNVNKEKIYIQSSPGSFAKITIPGLKTLTNRVIHNAILIVEKLPSAEDHFFTPPFLFLDVWDTTRNRYITVQNDFIEDNQGSYNLFDFGGNIKNNTYSFNVSRHVQGIISRKESIYPFRLYGSYETRPLYARPDVKITDIDPVPHFYYVNPQIARGRVVVGGGIHPAQKMRLRIIYSKI